MTDQQYTPTTEEVLATLRSNYQVVMTERQEDDTDRLVEYGAHFDSVIARIEAAAEQRGEIKALRDVEASLIDWDVLYGHEQGTAEDHESIRIAAWIGRRADQIANKEGDIA